MTSSKPSSVPSQYLSLQARAAVFKKLIKHPGWELLQQQFKPVIKSHISDVDAKEAFLYEAIRAQLIQELFSLPALTIRQADRAVNPAKHHFN